MKPRDDSSLRPRGWRGALDKGQGWGASFPRPAPNQGARAPLTPRDFLAEGQGTVVSPG